LHPTFILTQITFSASELISSVAFWTENVREGKKLPFSLKHRQISNRGDVGVKNFRKGILATNFLFLAKNF